MSAKRLVISLIVLNELRGAAVVLGVLWAGFRP